MDYKFGNQHMLGSASHAMSQSSRAIVMEQVMDCLLASGTDVCQLLRQLAHSKMIAIFGWIRLCKQEADPSH